MKKLPLLFLMLIYLWVYKLTYEGLCYTELVVHYEGVGLLQQLRVLRTWESCLDLGFLVVMRVLETQEV